jgi:hypothetical protein
MITSDRGPQFTSNLWFKLCKMLHLSHKQSTAYHPESNGVVKRLHRRLKNALRACAATATWSEELPFVLLGLRAQPREDAGLSPAEAVFGAPIVLPNEFLENEEMLVDAIIKNCSKTLHVPAVSLSRNNYSAQLPSELPGKLLSAPSSGSVGAASSHPFSCSTMAPTPSCSADPAPSPSELGHTTRLLPSAAPRLACPQTPCQAARVATADRQIRNQADMLQPSGSRFQTCWFLHLPLRRRHETVPAPFSYPARRFLHARAWRPIKGATDAVPIPSTGTPTEVGPMTSSPPGRGQILGGSTEDTCLHPWQRSDQSGILQ